MYFYYLLLQKIFQIFKKKKRRKLSKKKKTNFYLYIIQNYEKKLTVRINEIIHSKTKKKKKGTKYIQVNIDFCTNMADLFKLLLTTKYLLF